MVAKKPLLKEPPPAPRAVPRVPVDNKPIRVTLPLVCEACELLKKGRSAAAP